MFVSTGVWLGVALCLGSLRRVQALDNGLALTPPMGWLTWERFRCNTDCTNFPTLCISENLIRQMADAMVSEGYANVGYEYVIIDDCWLSRDRAPNGSLVADPDRFPRGIADLADYVHSLGLKFGIYEDLGTSTCGGYPGSLNYLELDAQTFASWGVDYVKFDGCNSDPADFDVKYPEFGRYLNQTGRPMVYSCEWPLYQDLNGIVSNYTSIAASCNVWRNHNDIEDSYNSFVDILNWHGDNQDRFADSAGPGAWNDPDMLLVGNFALSYEQSKAQMAIWAIMASPLIMSNDLREMDPKMKALLQNYDVIQISQDRLAKQGRRVYNEDGIQIWVRPVSPVVSGLNSHAVAVVSTRTDGAPYHLVVSLESIGVNNNDQFIVTEVFGSLPSQLLTPADNLDLLVNPTGALLLKCQVKSNSTLPAI